MREKIERLLAHRRMVVVAVIAAVALTLPALGTGYFADDYTHQFAFRPESRAPGGMLGAWDLFRFQGPDRGYFRHVLDLGVWPWWSAPTFRLAFLRPITSLSHAFDYHYLARFPAILHAENIALYAIAVLLAARFYRCVLAPAWAAGLAALLYAVDDAHSLSVTWIANRNALFAAVFSFAALVAHDRARREAHRRSAILAPILLVLGLLSGEAALATLGYLAAYALFLDEASPHARALSLAPYAVVVVVWTAAYRAMGYGAAGGGFYVDPAAEPAAFASALALRLPELLLAELAAPPAELWAGLPDRTLAVLFAIAIVALALGAIVVRRVVGKDRRAGFFATGMVLSLVPVCATWPNDRLLLFSGLGAFGLCAVFFAKLRERASPATAGARVLAGVFVLFHVVLAPVLLPVRAVGFVRTYSGYLARGDQTLPAYGPDQTVVVVNAPDLLVTSYIGCARVTHGGEPAKALRLLATAIDGNDGEVEGIDPHTIAITLREGFVHDVFSEVVRSAKLPFARGEVMRMDGMTAEVEALTPDGRPRRVRFRFDLPLTDPSFVWVRWEGQGYVPSPPPAPGAKAPLPSIDFYKALFGEG